MGWVGEGNGVGRRGLGWVGEEDGVRRRGGWGG